MIWLGRGRLATPQTDPPTADRWLAVVADLLVALLLGTAAGSALQPAQRALAGQRRAEFALAGEHVHQRIVAQSESVCRPHERRDDARQSTALVSVGGGLRAGRHAAASGAGGYHDGASAVPDDPLALVENRCADSRQCAAPAAVAVFRLPLAEAFRSRLGGTTLLSQQPVEQLLIDGFSGAGSGRSVPKLAQTTSCTARNRRNRAWLR